MADIQKLEKELWEAADNLRANSKLTSQQYCMPVLGLIFLRYAWGRFKMVDEQIKAKRAQSTGRQIPIEPDDYAKRGAMYLPEESRYDYLVNLPEDEANIGKRVNDAMAAIEKASPQLAGILPHDYTELGNDLLRETTPHSTRAATTSSGASTSTSSASSPPPWPPTTASSLRPSRSCA